MRARFPAPSSPASDPAGELKVLREALEDRLQAVASRSWQERAREEDLAARRRKDGQGPLPFIRVGGEAPGGGVLGIADPEDGAPVRVAGRVVLVEDYQVVLLVGASGLVRPSPRTRNLYNVPCLIPSQRPHSICRVTVR